MKITRKFLEDLKCCKEGISNFMQTPELQVDISGLKKIVVSDRSIYNDFVYMLSECKLYIVGEILYDNCSQIYYGNEKGQKVGMKKFVKGILKEEYIYIYNSDGYLTNICVGDNLIDFIYNDKGLLVEQIYSDGIECLYEYDKKGRLLCKKICGLVSERYKYKNDNLIEAMYGSCVYEYDENGLLIASIGTNGAIEYNGYDMSKIELVF